MNKSQPISGKITVAPGSLIDIDGSRLHLYCTGPHADLSAIKADLSNYSSIRLPTVIIESGCGWHSAMYIWLQKRLSKTLRVCSYDRAGLGWSEGGSQPQSHDAKTIATQLYRLLKIAKIKGPLLLVGHSIAGLYLRVFAHYYPDNIVGIVFLDSSHPRQQDLLGLKEYSYCQRLIHSIVGLGAKLGLTHYFNPLLNLNSGLYQHLPNSSKAQLIELSHRRQTYITPIKESDAFDFSARQVLAINSLGDLPLLVITGLDRSDVSFPSEQSRALFVRGWLALQRDLLRISSNSRHIVIENAGHGTLITKREHAERVAIEILQFVLCKSQIAKY